jgi:hypothetical protein
MAGFSIKPEVFYVKHLPGFSKQRLSSKASENLGLI